MARRLAVLSDFDGTITTTDIAEIILAEFAPPAWKAIEQLHRARRIGTRETMARQFDLVRGDRETLLNFVRSKARMDPGFPAFLRACFASEIHVEIVSEGLDFYVDELMKMWGIGIPVRANRAVFNSNRVRIEYPFEDPTCTLCGMCKLARVFELRAGGYEVAYIGDGDSDLCPAIEAHRVYAKDRLAELCDAEEIPYCRFRDFNDIAREVAAWRAQTS